MKVQLIKNNYQPQSFKGSLLKTPELEKYVKTLNSQEFDEFISNVARMKKVNDGKNYVFKQKESGWAEINSIKNGIETNVVLHGGRDKESVRYMFKLLFSKYAVKENLLNSRKNTFLNNLEEYKLNV